MRTNTSMNASESQFSSALVSEAQAAIRSFVTGGAIDAAASAAFGSGVSGAAVASTVLGFENARWPGLVLVDDEVLGGARGAYDRASDTIFLARDFASHSAHGSVISVIVEEIGHAIDARVNDSDAPGDEGAIFAQFVLGNAPDASELAGLQAENDHGAISVNGNQVAVEFASTANGAKVGIVYSETTAARYWGAMAYSQLFMNAQSQAAMAGVPYDVLTESDLTNLAKLSQYDALIFPSFRHVKASEVDAITNTLTQASNTYGVGLIVSGEFMSNNENGAAIGGDPYVRMASLLGVRPQTWSSGATPLTVNAGDVSHTMMQDYAAGELIHSYSSAWWTAFQAQSPGTASVLATQTSGGQTYSAVLSTTTGGRNVHFSDDAIMADHNLLWQAIDYAVNGSGITAGLQLSRNTSIVASRVDMDQAQETSDVNPDNGAGIYDLLLPIVQQWKTAYNYVASYYVDIGNNPPGQTTDWSISRPYYSQLLALGNELGSHSYTHPHNTDALTPAQIQFEFEQSKQVIEQQMSMVVQGAAVPGNPENLATALAILQYYSYLSGGFSGVGAGYTGAFGYLTPAMAADAVDKVYLAPNVSFDFSLVEFQGLTAEEAAARWQQEWAKLTQHSDVPILLWPWHDYGPTDWDYGASGDQSPYSTAMFTDFISRAHAAGAEFVTLADLANRISSFDDSAVSWSVAGNTVTATVTSSDAGRFALDLDNLGSQKIQSVANWYAYADDSVFLDREGGSYTINLTTGTPDDVTRIVSLPMRAELVSLNGNGTNLGFSIVGEGEVVVDLKDPGLRTPIVSGGTILNQSGNLLTIGLTGLGEHFVSVKLNASNSSPDYNSDGKSDILLCGGNGAVVVWEMNGASVQDAAVVGSAPSTWRMIDARPDYNADGNSDILWRLDDGRVVTWEMTGATVQDATVVGSAPATWNIIDARADYNGDGRSDVLWQLNDGRVVTWQMNGASVQDATVVGSAPASWNIVDGRGDYNADGKSDVLWRLNDGRVVTWQMNGASVQDATVVGTAPSSWSIVDGHGDYNGDGKSDVLWRLSDGKIITWEMNGALVQDATVVGTAPSNWSLVDARGDYNGDGRSDILWRASDGRIITWQMNGASVQDATVVGTAPSSWRIIDGHADYNADGRSDVLWRLTDGRVVTWQMNGTLIQDATVVGSAPATSSIPADTGATLVGTSGADSLLGTVSADTLRAGLGNDVLTGRSGPDIFVFDSALGGGNVDQITDFLPGSDRLLLSEVLFTSLSGGPLTSASFRAADNPSPSDNNDFILYNTTNGHVSYDADGSDAAAAIVFAILSGAPSLAADDIFIGLA